MDKEGQLVTYRNRSAFEKEFGHAVTPDRDIQRLQPTSDLGFIPTQGFKQTVHSALEHFCESDNLITSMIIHASNYMIQQDTGSNNDNFDQKLCENLHDALIHHMDHRMVALAYLIKISDFLPSLSKIYNGAFCHLIEEKNTLPQIYTFYFEQLEDKDFLLTLINDNVDAVFPTLNTLRKTFNSETRAKRKSSACKDEFSKKFLRCQEVQERDMPDRLEYLFFESYKIPLGITPIRHKNVAQYLGKMQCDEKQQWEIYTKIKTGKLSSQFPGVMISKDQKVLTKDLRRSLAFRMQHIIPKTGLILG